MAANSRRKRNNSYSVHSPEGNGSSFPVILYQEHLESIPLLPGKPARGTVSASRLAQIGCWCLAFVIFSFMVYNTSIHLVRCPLDPSARDTIRLNWEKEANQHIVLEREWQHKVQEQAQITEEWKREEEQHARMFEEMQRREREEREWERQEWQQEMVQHVHEFEEMQHREREDRDRDRQKWQREMEQHAHELEEMQRREREEREQDRQRWKQEVKEREQREEEERLRLNIYWGHVAVQGCTMFATREYSAKLMNLPTSWKDRLHSCKKTPLEIHGIPRFPKACEDRDDGAVIGRWEINQQEPECATYWDGREDKGCTSPGSGKKLIIYKLMNLPGGSNWEDFCATTPNSFDDMRFPGAGGCFTTVFGVYGRWEIEDGNCY